MFYHVHRGYVTQTAVPARGLNVSINHKNSARVEFYELTGGAITSCFVLQPKYHNTLSTHKSNKNLVGF